MNDNIILYIIKCNNKYDFTSIDVFVFMKTNYNSCKHYIYK